MNLPIQAKPVLRGVSRTKIYTGDGINPSWDWTCAIECAAALAKCVFTPDPVQCLISAGLGKCVRCL